MKLKILIKEIKELSKKDMNLMNKWRKIEFGKKEKKNFKKDYLPNARFFFIKDNEKIVAFGCLRDVKINYSGNDYNILGICNIVAIEKGKGYGKELISAMIKYLKKKGKTGLGFCEKGKTKFYEKAGLKTKKDFAERFALKTPKTGEIVFDREGGDGLYFEGKDGLIKKMLSTKSIGYYSLPGINIPHW
jgi:predicted N-acetyltransferase YhbS